MRAVAATQKSQQRGVWSPTCLRYDSMKHLIGFLVCGFAICGGTMLAASAKDGEAVYTAKCKNCHGVDGSGNPAIAKMMNVTMKPLGSATDADVNTAVTMGVVRGA